MDELILREFQPEDQDAVWSLNVEGLKEAGAYIEDDRLEVDLRDPESWYSQRGDIFLVGEVTEQVVTTGALENKNGKIAEVKRVSTHPDFRRRGYAERVLLELERHAKEFGFERITLDTTTKQEADRKLFEKHGYVEYERKEIGGLTCIFYHKFLEP